MTHARATIAAIHFSSRNAAAVTVTTRAGELETAKAAEVVLFALYSGQLLADMGEKDWALAFSAGLASVDDETLAVFVAGDEAWGVRVERFVDTDQASARFDAVLNLNDAPLRQLFTSLAQRDWRVKMWTARRERRHGNHYVATSIALLYHHLLKSRASDSGQRQRLQTTATLIAELHHAGLLRLPVAWSHVAMQAAETAWFSPGSNPVEGRGSLA